MTKKVSIIGRIIPIWLVVMLLIASGTGVAVGSVIVGKVTGEINVSTTGQGGGLLIGAPICDFVKHTPNDVRTDNMSSPPAPVPTPWLLGTPLPLSGFPPLAFPDGVYLTTLAAVTGDAFQFFRFQVGEEAYISKMVLSHKGKVVTSGNLSIWDGTAWQNLAALSTSDVTTTATIDGTTTPNLANTIINSYVYVMAYSPDAVSTDYISLTTTQTAFDFKDWAGFKAPEITHRIFTVPERCIGVHASDQTAFEAAAEIAVGDWWLFILPVKNSGSNDLTAKLTLQVPTCLNAYVFSPDEVRDTDFRVHNVVQIGINTWKLIVNSGAAKQDDDDYLYILINAHDDCPPGIYAIQGVLEQIPY